MPALAEGGGGLASVPSRPTRPTSPHDPRVARFAVLAARQRRPRCSTPWQSTRASRLVGRNWDALDESLALPSRPTAGPSSSLGTTRLGWRPPTATFRAIIAAAAEARARAGDGSLLVVAGPRPSREVPAMAAPTPFRSSRSARSTMSRSSSRSIETALGLWHDLLGLELETSWTSSPTTSGSRSWASASRRSSSSSRPTTRPASPASSPARARASTTSASRSRTSPRRSYASSIDGLELIDSAPRRGAEGPVAFLHPRSCHGVLVELIEAPGGPAWRRWASGDPRSDQARIDPPARVLDAVDSRRARRAIGRPRSGARQPPSGAGAVVHDVEHRLPEGHAVPGRVQSRVRRRLEVVVEGGPLGLPAIPEIVGRQQRLGSGRGLSPRPCQPLRQRACAPSAWTRTPPSPRSPMASGRRPDRRIRPCDALRTRRVAQRS